MLLLIAHAVSATPRFPIEAAPAVKGGPGIQYLGYGMAPLGDLDGDGWPDVLVSDTSFELSGGLVEAWMRHHEPEEPDTGDTAAPVDTAQPEDTDAPPDSAGSEDTTPDEDVLGDADTGQASDRGGCGCTTGGWRGAALLAGLVVLARRRRGQAHSVAVVPAPVGQGVLSS